MKQLNDALMKVLPLTAPAELPICLQIDGDALVADTAVGYDQDTADAITEAFRDITVSTADQWIAAATVIWRDVQSDGTGVRFDPSGYLAFCEDDRPVSDSPYSTIYWVKNVSKRDLKAFAATQGVFGE